MVRRAYVRQLHIGENRLPGAAAHHVRNVLRLGVGEAIELFTADGTTAEGTLLKLDGEEAVVGVTAIRSPVDSGEVLITVAAALPKGDRADWMVEKLSELGVARFVPVSAERSVVLPAGQNKVERWRRIAIESARQSGRAGVMAVDGLTPLAAVLAAARPGEDAERHLRVQLSTAADAPPLVDRAPGPMERALLLIGPEGGWTDAEVLQFRAAGIEGVRLTRTILRVETAAVVAAGVLACRGAG